MIDRLPQDRWPWNTAHSATREEAPFASPQCYTLRQPSPVKQATPAFPQRSVTERIDASETPSFIPPIMVIDDSLTVRKIMETTHRRQGFFVQTFGDGVEALQWLHEHPTVIPGLVYLDICMPRMDGYDVARHLHSRPHLSAVPIVMLTGRDGVLDRLKGRLAGAKGYITKPFRGEEILIETLHYLPTGKPTSRASGENQHQSGIGAVPMYRLAPRF
ncbi:MAG TPA: response regulator [Ktedonobacteraceae bacterium]|nr:response regulator [Ktedonobacteraceae bacterium]